MVSRVAGRAVLLLLCLVVCDAVRQVSMHKDDVSAAQENQENEHEHVQEEHAAQAAHSKLEWYTYGGKCARTSECNPNCKCSHGKCRCYR